MVQNAMGYKQNKHKHKENVKTVKSENWPDWQICKAKTEESVFLAIKSSCWETSFNCSSPPSTSLLRSTINNYKSKLICSTHHQHR